MSQDLEHKELLAHVQRFNAPELAMPTGRILDRIYYEVRIVSQTEPNTYSMGSMVLRARPILGFGSLAIPSAEWFFKYLGQFYFVISYIGGSRQTATIVGFLPHMGSQMAKDLNFGRKKFVGSLQNSADFDDDTGTSRLASEKTTEVISKEKTAVSGEKSASLSSEGVGLYSESKKNYLGAENKKSSMQPSVKGDELKSILSSLFTLLQSLTATPAGAILANGAPLNASPDLISLRNRLNTLLSSVNYLE